VIDRRIALSWVVGVLFVGSLLDAWLYYHLGNDSTISQTVLWLSRECFLVPMAIGWLVGHLLWPRSPGRPWYAYVTARVAVFLAIASVASSLASTAFGEPWWIDEFLRDYSLAPFAAGIIFGHILTPQTDIKRGSA